MKKIMNYVAIVIAVIAIALSVYAISEVNDVRSVIASFKSEQEVQNTIFEVEDDELHSYIESIIEKLANEKIDSDKTLSINALVELRKSYGMTIEDSELKSQYEKYIRNQVLNATTSTSTSSNN